MCDPHFHRKYPYFQQQYPYVQRQSWYIQAKLRVLQLMLLSGRRELFTAHVIARLVGADELAPVALGDLFGEERPAALRARLGESGG